MLQSSSRKIKIKNWPLDLTIKTSKGTTHKGMKGNRKIGSIKEFLFVF